MRNLIRYNDLQKTTLLARGKHIYHKTMPNAWQHSDLCFSTALHFGTDFDTSSINWRIEFKSANKICASAESYTGMLKCRQESKNQIRQKTLTKTLLNRNFYHISSQ